METTNALTALINKTSDKILDDWSALAKIDGTGTDTFIDQELDKLAMSDQASDWELCKTLSGRYSQRIMGVA